MILRQTEHLIDKFYLLKLHLIFIIFFYIDLHSVNNIF